VIKEFVSEQTNSFLLLVRTTTTARWCVAQFEISTYNIQFMQHVIWSLIGYMINEHLISTKCFV